MSLRTRALSQKHIVQLAHTVKIRHAQRASTSGATRIKIAVFSWKFCCTISWKVDDRSDTFTNMEASKIFELRKPLRKRVFAVPIASDDHANGLKHALTTNTICSCSMFIQSPPPTPFFFFCLHNSSLLSTHGPNSLFFQTNKRQYQYDNNWSRLLP